MLNNKKIALTIGLVLLLGGMVLSGCESDAVAPQDEAPALSEENVAQQAAIIAMAISEIGPKILTFTPPLEKTIYTFNFKDFDYVTGQVDIDYRLGGAEGTSSTPEAADYAHLYTVGNPGLSIVSGDIETMTLTADIMGNLDQDASTATILAGSQGDLVAGIYTGHYAIDGLVVSPADYPTDGTITFTGGIYTIVTTFDGSNTAIVSVDTFPTWSLNLDTGELTTYMPPTTF